ncbi:MAG: hypothetical protein E3K37_14175 [Candidatus Kuenenia sp.]|nr:hypothetical protein [Candidatus Kuenenia hertensis]
MNNKTLWWNKWWVIGAFLMVGAGILCPFFTSWTEKSLQTEHTEETDDESWEVTPSGHLAEARKSLAREFIPNADPMNTSCLNVCDARKHLEAIHEDSCEYLEARRLMAEVERREAEIEKLSELLTCRLLKKQWEELAGRLEHYFLGKNMVVYVHLEGEEEDCIVLEYMLWSRPLVYKTVNGTGFLKSLKQLGFKKVIYDATHGYSWTYNLEGCFEE